MTEHRYYAEVVLEFDDGSTVTKTFCLGRTALTARFLNFWLKVGGRFYQAWWNFLAFIGIGVPEKEEGETLERDAKQS